MQRGQTFAGRYQVVGALGKGGMGTVYEAIELASGQTVALKLITGVEINDEVLLRFIREAESSERIQSPNVVRIYDLGSDLDTGIPYMAMERLVGTDMSKLLKQLQMLPPNTAAKIALQACAGLKKAHELGIIHRDIKPGNLFVADTGTHEHVVKLLDFGIAKLSQDAQQAQEEELTQMGSVLGSPHYMSPEQAQGLPTIDPRSDLWSIGVVLYKMLCGRTPHSEIESLGQIIVAVCSQPAIPVQTLVPWVPPELSAIIDRCLRIDPDQRFQSAQELETALLRYLGPDRRLLSEDLRAVDDSDRMYMAPEPDVSSVSTQHNLELLRSIGEPKQPSRSWLTIAGAAGLLLLTCVGVTLAVRGRGDPLPEAILDAPPHAASMALSAPVQEPEPVIIERFEVRDVVISLQISSSAQVFLDGEAVQPVEGGLPLSGVLGSEHEVRIVDGTKEKTETVVISESGAKPARIVMASSPSTSGTSSTRPRQLPSANPPVKGPAKSKGLQSTGAFE